MAVDGARTAGRDADAPPTETDDRPVEPVDYAALNGIYLALLACVVATTRNRGARNDPVEGSELIPIAGATFALSKLIAREKAASWVREPFVEVRDGDRRPRGERMRHALGELVTCTRCLGASSALGIVGLMLASPAAGRTVTSVLATSAANDFGQAAFRWLCRKADEG